MIAKMECYALQDDILLAFVEIKSWPNTSVKKKALQDVLANMHAYTGTLEG